MKTRPGLRLHALGALALTSLLAVAVPDTPVADAAMRGDVDAVQALVRSGADVNDAQADGMTALHWAAELGEPRIAKVVLEAGANADAVTRLGNYTPLHLAARSAHGDVAAILLDAGADAMARTNTGATPLHFAAGAGDAVAVKALLAHGAKVDARESSWEQTPLMWAADYGRLDAVKALLAAGADPSLTSKVIHLPTEDAVDREAKKARDKVLAEFKKEAGDPTEWHPTPEQVQAAVEAAEAVQKAGIPDKGPAQQEEGRAQGEPGYSGLVGDQGGLTALLHAVREGREATALALLDGGADVNEVSAGDHTSPLLMAMINGNFDLGLELLQRGADPNLQSDAGATPLYAAIETQWAPKSRYPQQQAYTVQKATYLDVMESLLKAGADPNVRLKKHLWYMSYTFDLLGVNTAGSTAFWRAAYATDVDAMKLLVKYGADPNIPTEKEPARRYGRGGKKEGPDPSGLPPVPDGGPGVYPIHAASGVGYGEGFAGNSHRHVPDGWLPAVKYLVEELGADVNARDFNGYTALHHAAARGDNELIKYLVAHGADVTVVSRKGQTTVDMANGPVQRIQPFPETIQLLESLGAKNNHNCLSC